MNPKTPGASNGIWLPFLLCAIVLIAGGGGAVQNAGAQTEFVQCQFIDNVADSGSAIYTSHTLPVLDVDGSLYVNNSFNADRGMPSGGGALDLNQTYATIKNSGFIDNKRSEEDGAAIYSWGSYSILDISNSYFYQNIITETFNGVDGRYGRL